MENTMVLRGAPEKGLAARVVIIFNSGEILQSVSGWKNFCRTESRTTRSLTGVTNES
jgi:hypothetical protein|tara:strand:- start:352 stop:522 length:171 start_codon:yes stop_codon:yes gene_type:complete